MFLGVWLGHLCFHYIEYYVEFFKKFLYKSLTFFQCSCVIFALVCSYVIAKEIVNNQNYKIWVCKTLLYIFVISLDVKTISIITSKRKQKKTKEVECRTILTSKLLGFLDICIPSITLHVQRTLDQHPGVHRTNGQIPRGYLPTQVYTNFVHSPILKELALVH